MSKKVLIDAFYSQFGELLNQLATMYPDDPDFAVFVDNLGFARSMNPMLPINIIKTEVLDTCLDKIKAHDETFFMNYEYTSHEEVDLDIVNKLRKYYGSMSDLSKEIVWRYIDVITRIAEKVTSM